MNALLFKVVLSNIILNTFCKYLCTFCIFVPFVPFVPSVPLYLCTFCKYLGVCKNTMVKLVQSPLTTSGGTRVQGQLIDQVDNFVFLSFTVFVFELSGN